MYTALLALVQHYFDYLRSPPVLLVILIIVGPISLELFKNIKLGSYQTGAGVPGCFRLGITKGSRLNDQHALKADADSGTRSPQIKALFTYPVKSCRGVELAASEVGPTGLKYDRLFTFAQRIPKTGERKDISDPHAEDESEWRFITQREFPRLALIETELWVPRPGNEAQHGKGGRKQPQPARSTPATSGARKDASQDAKSTWANNGGCLVLRFTPKRKFNVLRILQEDVVLYLPLNPTQKRMQEKSYALEPLSIWIDRPQAINITGEMLLQDLDTLRAFLGVSNELGVFRVDPNHHRTISRSLPPERPDKPFCVGFGDAFPLHLLGVDSVYAQDHELPTKSAMKGTLDAKRFRANIYVSGAAAYDEDEWKKIKMGRCIVAKKQAHLNGDAKDAKTVSVNSVKHIETEGQYHVACRTARCKLPNVDQTSGIRDANEPLTTMRRTRQVDAGAYPHPCLGMQMIPLFQQGLLRVGDAIEVLERGEHHYEKML